MKHLFTKCIFVIIIILIASGAYAAECDNPRSSEDVVYCLGKELREYDVKINHTYQTLISKLAKDEQEKLRQGQRSWIKERDAVCNCTSKESDREKWYQWLLKDYRKTVCVTRYTRQRISELDRMLTDLSPKPQDKEYSSVPLQKAPSKNKTVNNVQADYQVWSISEKNTGHWYFEITVNQQEIAGFSPTALWTGCRDNNLGMTSGAIFHIRSADINLPIYRMGFALDLESGKLYPRVNGTWTKGLPGSSGGFDLKLSHTYRCGVETTAPMAPLIEKGYLESNFGSKSFVYSIPDGYRPLDEGFFLFPKSYSGHIFTDGLLGAHFVLIPAGTFMMGSPADDPERIVNETLHEVTISKPFYLQTTEVTQGQWKRVMGNNPSRFNKCGDDCPVEQVSWNDARDFISRLNQMAKTDKYRLPTEAEWEYAAKAGSSSSRYGDCNDIAWYADNSNMKTHAVGQKLPNAWGLYDMLGNVWEWCYDYLGDYTSGSITDPVGKPHGFDIRITRGGGYAGKGWGCRATSRHATAPKLSGESIGFRLALTP